MTDVSVLQSLLNARAQVPQQLADRYEANSKWAAPMAPQWNAQDQLVSPGARILFDERQRKSEYNK